MRVRVSLGEGIAHGTAPTRLWWPLPLEPVPVVQFVSQLLLTVGISSRPSEQVMISLEGFNIFKTVDTGILKDGDLLEVDIVGGGLENPIRATQIRKRKHEAVVPEPAQKPKIGKRCEVTTEDQLKAAVVAQTRPSSVKRPSRSARRKAAKRRWKRLGFPSPTVMGKKKHENGTGGGNKSREEKALSDDRDNSGEKSEMETSSSGDTTSSADSDTSSSYGSESSSSSKSVSEDDHHKYPTIGVVTEENFVNLIQIFGMPAVGQIVAYKLLEIGECFTPQVSEVRLGKIIETFPTLQKVVVQPYPDPDVHPLSRRFMHNKEKEVEDEALELAAEPPSSYDWRGIPTTELSSFVDMRCLFDFPSKQAEKMKEIYKAYDPLGPSTYSKLGPPRPARLQVPRTLKSLVESLERRREELSTPNPPGAALQNHNTAEDDFPAIGAVKEKSEVASTVVPPSSGRGRISRRGSFHSALGPTLRLLRSTQQLE